MFVVGDATYRRAEEAGFIKVHNARGDATDLVALLSTKLAPADGVLLVLTSQHQGSRVCKLLRERGFRVIRRAAYRIQGAKKLPPALARVLVDSGPATILFYSAGAAGIFVDLLHLTRLDEATKVLTAIAISPAVLEYLTTSTWQAVHIAARPNQASMLALVR